MDAETELAITQATDLMPLPDVYQKVKAVIDDPESSELELVKALSLEPALCARLLKVANSPFFGFAASVDTLSRAINLLGMQQVHDLVLALSLGGTLAKVETNFVDLKLFWRTSVACAIVARKAAVDSGLRQAERLFVAGLLHRIGDLVLDRALPEPLHRALALCKESAMPWQDAQRKVMGTDSAEVTAAVMRRWNFPESLYIPVQFQNDPSAAAGQETTAAVLHCAARLSVQLAQAGTTKIDTSWLAGVTAATLGAEHWQQIAMSTQPVIDETVGMILPQAA